MRLLLVENDEMIAGLTLESTRRANRADRVRQSSAIRSHLRPSAAVGACARVDVQTSALAAQRPVA